MTRKLIYLILLLTNVSFAGTYHVNIGVFQADTNGTDYSWNPGIDQTDLATLAPVAAFSGTPLTGYRPLTVQFTDSSTNTPTSWAWDFDNSGTTDSTDQNPSYEYTSEGSYTVKLTATNVAGSDSETKAGYVVVGGPAYSLYGSTFLYTSANWSSPDVYLEVFMLASNGTIYARLWDVSTGAAVTSSEISTSEPNYTRVRSGALTLSDANEYRIQFGVTDANSGQYLSGAIILK